MLTRWKNYWNASIRRQLVLSYALASVLFVLIFGVLMLVHQRNFLYRATEHHAQEMATSLAASARNWVLVNDVAGLQEVVEGFSNDPDLKFSLVISLRGEMLAAKDRQLIGRYVNDALSLKLLASTAEPVVLVDESSIIDVAAPIMAGNRHIGWSRVALSHNESNANLMQIGYVGLGFSMLALLAAIGIATKLATRFSHRLDHLIRATKSVEQGKRDVRANLTLNDEVGQLAHSFNGMLDTLHDSEVKLGRINRLYAAWIACNAITVQKKDESELLNGICQALARDVPFELAWIGVPDADGWVAIKAAAGVGADYLPGIKISVDANKPEGRGPMGTAIRDGKHSVFNDFSNVSVSGLWAGRAASHHFRAAAAYPLFRSGKCFGAIGVYSADLGFFNPELTGLMNALSADISFALTNLDLERQRHLDIVQLERAAKVFEYSKEAIFVTDSDNRIISVNGSFTEITGYQADEVMGKDPEILSSGRHDAGYYALMWNSLDQHGSWQGEIWNRRKNGEIYPEDLTIISVKDEHEVPVNYIAIFSDTSDRKIAEDRIRQLAHYDTLTGLPNRLLFNDRLQQAIAGAQRNQTKLALLFLDLDRFKQINDTLGHDAGDQLLKMVAERLLTCVREQDTVSRLGGDEFIALLPGADEAGAVIIARKMMQSITQAYLIGDHELRISTSIGLAIYPDHAHDADALIKNADVAMYRAKAGGRNQHLLFDASMNASAYERLTLETNLRVALERQQFQLYYQPQIDLANGRIVGCEALIRWHHPELGMVSPAEFIPLAEETGLIGPISSWVLEEAIRQASAWRAAGLQPLVMGVNLSALQFHQNDLLHQVKSLLEQYALPPDALELELTEGILMQGVERTLVTLRDLSLLGVMVSIDDFGTGYSSLSYLKRFPIRTLKIDQTFVRDITIDNNDATMVRTIILMAHSLNLHTIAEGVETEEQAAFLREFGCQKAQGYLFGRPMPADEFVKRLTPI